MPAPLAPPTERPSSPSGGGHGRSLLVVDGGGTTETALPASGEVLLGRSPQSGVMLQDRSVSWSHAVLHLGEEIAIEDLGSTNGTRVHGSKLVPRRKVAITVGDVVEVGKVLIRVQRRRDAGAERGDRPQAGFEQVRAMAERVARGTISVLILGETGVGKDVMAHAIHQLSPRAARPLLELNCASLSEALLESELFGHERGAFTGAVASKPGLLETAQGGTVFLDEVGELPGPLQAKLLRVVEDRRVTRVGGLEARPVDVRFLAATSRDLEQEIAAGRFRRDLYFRLAGATLVVPPLRARIGEIPGLVRTFVAEACASSGRTAAPEVPRDVMDLLLRHDWPGNIRELRNVIERAVLLCDGPMIRPEHIDVVPSSDTPMPPSEPDDRRAIDDRSQRIVAALRATAGNQTRAARLLGVSRRTLTTWLGIYGFARPRK